MVHIEKKLFNQINYTSSSIGRKYLFNEIKNPLSNKENIEKRYTVLEKFLHNDNHNKIREYVKMYENLDIGLRGYNDKSFYSEDVIKISAQTVNFVRYLDEIKILHLLDSYTDNFNNQTLIKLIGEVDFYCNNAIFSIRNKCTRPVIYNNYTFGFNVANMRSLYINDCVPINIKQNNSGFVIFGENASGKSCVVNSICDNILLAQTGLFTPCDKFCFYPYKNIFGILYKNDDVSKKQSHFTNEIDKINTICNDCNENSLIIGDEICHNTEVKSGCDITSAIIHFLHSKNANFIISSHYHDITKILDKNKCSFHHMENYELCDGICNSYYGNSIATKLISNNEIKDLVSYYSNKKKM